MSRVGAVVRTFAVAVALIAIVTSGARAATLRVIRAAGPNLASEPLQSAIAQFEAAIGGVDNGTTQGPLSGGFRVMNWSGVPDQVWPSDPATSAQFITPDVTGLLNLGSLNP